MKQIYFFVHEPSVLSHWNGAVTFPKKVLFSLKMDEVAQQIKSPEDTLLLIQHHKQNSDLLEALLNKGYYILLFSNHPTQEEGYNWFRKGIRGYVNCYAHREIINQAIETVLTNNIWLGENIMKRIINALDRPTVDLSWKERLTEREIQVAEFILKGCSNREISEALFITERTIKSHVHNLLEKFEVRDRLALVLIIQRMQHQSV